MKGQLAMSKKKQNVVMEPYELEEVFSSVEEKLLGNVSEELLSIWSDYMDIEKIDSNEIVISYHGEKPIDKVNKLYRETLWSYLNSTVGHRKKFKIVKRKIKKEKDISPKAKKTIKTAKLLVLSLIFAAIAFSLIVLTVGYINNRDFRETFYNVSSLKADNRIRVAVISDLHSVSYGKDNEKLVSRTGKLKPDLILLAGDIIDSDNPKLDSIIKMCEGFSEIAPAYYVYGNNETELVYDFPLKKEAIDKKLGFNDDTRDEKKLIEYKDTLFERLEKSGVKVLKNEIATLKAGTVDIDVFGILTSNPSAFYEYTEKSFAGYRYENTDRLKITLVHEPYIFEEFTESFWGDLLVCGHTHGGTIRVPVLGPLYTREGGLFPERSGDYVYGRYDVSGRPLIVSGGLENNNLLRLNNEPELVIIDINKF